MKTPENELRSVTSTRVHVLVDNNSDLLPTTPEWVVPHTANVLRSRPNVPNVPIGEIPIATPHEKGFPNHVARADAESDWIDDLLILNERWIAVRVEGRGDASCSRPAPMPGSSTC